MDAFMSTLIKMSLRGTVIILIVLFVRFLLKKLQISHKYIIGLWAMVFFYFIFPWKINLPVGFWNNVSVPEEVRVAIEDLSGAGERQGAVDDMANSVNNANSADSTDSDYLSSMVDTVPDGMSFAWQGDDFGTDTTIAAELETTMPVEPEAQDMSEINDIERGSSEEPEVRDVLNLRKMLELLWLIVITCLIGYMFYSYLVIKNKLLLSVLYQDNIWWAENIDVPMVFGFIFPQIYLPVSMEAENLDHVIAHEKMHVKRKDGLFKMIAYMVCLIHWFNPFIWVAYFLFGNDMEKACDEEVIRGMESEKRKEYAYALLHIAAENGRKKKRVFVAPICFDEGNVKSRIINIMKYKYTLPGIGAAVMIVILSLSVMFLTEAKGSDGLEDSEQNILKAEGSEGAGEEFDTEGPKEAEGADSEKTGVDEEAQAETQEEIPSAEELLLNLNISDYYSYNIGDAGQLYTIDEENTLWGCGRNEYGQLGRGTQDYDFHEDMVKIAENVIHVDYTHRGFTIFLTEDHKLYGIGTASSGALQEYDEITLSMLWNPEHYTVNTPKLLMENVVYAKCGCEDVVCLLEDGSVWTWGTVWRSGQANFSITEPQKILEDVVMVTGGWFNHAALQSDGSVWTWGHNYVGNCGVEGKMFISEPVKVAENAVMVWTGTMEYNVDCKDISEFDKINERGLENTIILKNDGTYWACGMGIGEEVKHLDFYWEVWDDYEICSSEFMQIADINELKKRNSGLIEND